MDKSQTPVPGGHAGFIQQLVGGVGSYNPLGSRHGRRRCGRRRGRAWRRGRRYWRRQQRAASNAHAPPGPAGRSLARNPFRAAARAQAVFGARCRRRCRPAPTRPRSSTTPWRRNFSRIVIARWGDAVLPDAPPFRPLSRPRRMQADTQFPYDAADCRADHPAGRRRMAFPAWSWC